MTGVEVLAPLRLETRFASNGSGWRLHLRVYPDDFLMAADVPAPGKEELDVLEAALVALSPGSVGTEAEAAAFRSAAAALGAQRTWWLWRTATAVVNTGAGPLRQVDRTAEVDQANLQSRPAVPLGLPDALDVWLVRNNGRQDLAVTLHPRHSDIIADLGLETLKPAGGKLPRAWWLDYQRAKDVGLATELTLASTDDLAALVVVGNGTVPAADLFTTHRDGGRLGLVPQGTPTNTVSGERAVDVGDNPAAWLPLLAGNAGGQVGARALFKAGGIPELQIQAELPLPGGDHDHSTPGRLAVRALWPVLWGRWLRDISGAGPAEAQLARWAEQWLAVEGPLPAVRVGDQPYGLLPTSVFTAWRAQPEDDPEISALEDHVLRWAIPWRSEAASAVPAAAPIIGADARRKLDLLGRHAPSQHWMVRPVLDLPTLQATQIQAGAPVRYLTNYDRSSARAWRGQPQPLSPIAAAGTRRHLPGPPLDGEEDPEMLIRIAREFEPELLYYGREWRSGLIGHLARESMIIARGMVGRARNAMDAGLPVDASAPLPLDEHFADAVMRGTDQSAEELRGAGQDGEQLAERLIEVQKGIVELADYLASQPEEMLRAVKAALDTASFRVDPWLTGVAFRRLERMAASGAPFRLGAYGWVDAPRPWQPEQTGLLAPGPTGAGLLHAPSFTQAQTAAVLRDAAVRTTPKGRWDITLTSDKIRAAVALAEQVQLGVHPMEALGLQVEAVAGDHNVIRVLRRNYSTTTGDPLRRVCDGPAVLEAARMGTLPPEVPATFAASVAPLGEVLDTYADLLLVDGVHALMTGRPEAAGAAMEAAAGLGRPPDLRGIRTPREATSVSITCWGVLPAPAVADRHPAAVADPAFAAMLPPGSLAGQGDRTEDGPLAARLAAILGGGETDQSSPSATAFPDLAEAITENLTDRWQTVADLAGETLAALRQLNPADPTAGGALLRLNFQWRLRLPLDTEEGTTEDLQREAVRRLEERLAGTSAGGPPATPNALRAAVRQIIGRPEAPILPVVARTLLPAWAQTPDGPDSLDKVWLEIVAAVHPRLAALEAHQLTSAAPWPAAVHAPGDDPWSAAGPVHVAYGPGLTGPDSQVAVAVIDAWTDSVPSGRHVSQAAFGFNAPKTRAPQAVLLAVPPDPSQRLSGTGLLDAVLEVRELIRARSTRPTDRDGLPTATPAPLVQLEDPVNLLEGWPG